MNIKKKPTKLGEIKKSIPYDFDGNFRKFAAKLEKTDFNLDIFYKNIKKVKLVEGKKREMSDPSVVAEYNLFSNTIRYLKKYYIYGIFHELFHLATTIIGKKRIYSGFFQMDIESGRYIGLGLNDAYTALMDDRYFGEVASGKKEIVGKSYFVTKYLVSMVEEAVGRENMEKWYSTCDLETLTSTLANATDYESTIRFYQALDNIFMFLESKKFYRNKLNVILESYEYASIYVARLYLDIIEQAYIEEKMTDYEYEDFLLELKEQLQKPLIIGKHFKKTSDVLTDDDFDNLVKETMKKSLKKYT